MQKSEICAWEIISVLPEMSRRHWLRAGKRKGNILSLQAHTTTA